MAAMTHIVRGEPKPVTKTYLTTEQFIKVYKSLSDEKSRELSAAQSADWSATQSAARYAARYAAWYAAWNAAWSAAQSADWSAAWSAAQSADWSAAQSADWSATQSAARYAAWSADLAVLAKDKITVEQFEILTSPWTSCGLSLYAEDWEEVLNPIITEPKNFGAIVEAGNGKHPEHDRCQWVNTKGVNSWTNGFSNNKWSDLINPTIISEGVEG